MYLIGNLDPYAYSAKARARLSRVGEYKELPITRQHLMETIHNYDALILRFAQKVDEELLTRATKLRVIGTNTTGTDHIDSDKLKENGVRLFSLRDLPDVIENINSTAELTWGLTIALLRNILPAAQSALSETRSRDDFLGTDLRGKTLGILGLGRIGRKVARYGSAFDMRVVAHSLPSDEDIEGVETIRSIDNFLSQTEILSIHLPLNHSTNGLLDERKINALPKGAVVINTSRGRIICEHALISALQSGHLAGAALDVYDGEDEGTGRSVIVDFARNNRRLLLTPHIGGVTAESWATTEYAIADVVARYLETL